MIQFPAPPDAPLPPEQIHVITDTGLAWSDIGEVVAITALIVGTVLLLLPLVRAWARRIEGHGRDPVLLEEVTQLRDRVAELDGVAARVHELEERLDFAERMLVKRDNSVLPAMEHDRNG